MGEKWDKFLLLLWKNFLLQWRHPKQTLVEILAPVLFTALIVTLRSLVHPVHHAASFYTPFENKMPFLATFRPNLTWSPDNAILTEIMDETVDEINRSVNGTAFFNFTHYALKDSYELHQHLKNEINMIGVLAGIQFDDSLANLTKDDELPKNLNISLRFPGELRTSVQGGSWKTDNIFPVYQVNGPRNIKLNEGGLPSYYSEGFLTLQQELSLTLIKRFKSDFERSTAPINMQRFPYPEFTEDMLISALVIFVGLIFMLSFVYTCISTVKIITSEKEKQLKEIMKIMGLPNWLHWTAWFVKSFIFLLISITIMVALMKIKWYPNSEFTVFTHSNPFVIFLFLTLFSCSTITFCFAISVFFSKANIAATIAGMAWFLSYFPYSFLQGRYNSLSLTTKLSTSLFSNTAMAFGFHLMVSFEAIDEGVHWHNMWKTAHPDDNLAFGYILIMLVIDTILYLLITLYVEAIFPGDYGVPQPFYFPFTYSYWFGRAQYVDSKGLTEESISSEFFELSHNLDTGIKITNLSKAYGRNKMAVKGLNLNMYKNQITVLLGHNGAGKTTTMSMLTGMIPPTNGTAVVAGYDVCKDIESVRKSLGVCPQHNILFDELTVKEHLYFFCLLKGVEKNKISAEIENYVSMLDLIPKADAMSDTLSGGMKRKLSVGIALCGNSSVVILDEPTAGMDPSARRALWDLLQSQRLGRTILLSTHFMDEADLLGDRIAIMAGGQLKCCGSSFFLKKKYGAGYHLVMDKLLNCDSGKVTGLLKKYIPSIEISSNVGSELTYVLHNEHSAIFEKMLEEFELCSGSLGIGSYGISLTTLEEVFMKVGADQHEEEAIPRNEGFLNPGFENDTETNHPFSSTVNFLINDANTFKLRELNEKTGQLLTGWQLQKNQFVAMFMKKGLSTLRSWILTLIQICIPVLFLILAIIIVREKSVPSYPVKLMVRLSRFADSKTVITRFTNNSYSENYMTNLENDNKTLINWERDSMTTNMLEETRKDSRAVHYEYIVGATFHTNNTITAWFNNQPYHSAPLTLQMVVNTILQTELNSTNYTIQFYNHPLPYSVSTEFSKLIQVNNMGFQIAFNIGFSMAFVSSFYIMFIIRERACKVKHLQFVSGVNIISFWMPTFVCDFLAFTVTSLCTVLAVSIFQEEGFRTFSELGRLFSILLIFGFAMLPTAYLMSYVFDIPSTGYTKMTLINIFTGVSAFLIVYVLKYPKLELQDVSDILHWVFLIIPHYSLSSGVQNLNEVYTTNKLCSKAIENCIDAKWNSFPNISIPREYCEKAICIFQEKCCSVKHYYSWQAPGIGRNVVFTLSIAIVLTVLLLLIEYKAFEKILNLFQKTRHIAISADGEDDDVLEERAYVAEIVSKGTNEIEQHNLLLNDVTKFYGDFLAVNNLNLSVKGQECFGLLGINGAGKTTTFKMLTGDIKLSLGNAWINGLSIKSDIKKIYQQIGYCPQFDALLDDLTCMETLIIFGLLRGITREESKLMARHLSYQFDFHQHIRKKVKELSGGNKRKLSTAIAFIGNPQVVYLDEPTTGMDPVTKRYLWDALCKVRDSGKCIVLTSHSMEECEALCTRLGIMVNGTFKCLGSTQHLKSKFSDGYTLTIKAKRDDEKLTFASSLEVIETYVMNHFPDVTVREKHEELITFYITDRSQKWSKMFGVMERAKKMLNIEDYSLGQCSLEQVFLTFTKYQREN